MQNDRGKIKKSKAATLWRGNSIFFDDFMVFVELGNDNY